MSTPKTKTTHADTAHWGRLTFDSLIRDALKRAGVYDRAANAGWPIGVSFAENHAALTEVTITAGCAPNTIVLGTAVRKDGESFKPELVALTDQVIRQLLLML